MVMQVTTHLLVLSFLRLGRLVSNVEGGVTKGALWISNDLETILLRRTIA